MTSTEEVLRLLEAVRDPEIPALSVIDMGIVRAVELVGENVTVKITPTYSGCPAMSVIENDIRQCLEQAGMKNITVLSVLSPAWTTDWLSESAKEKLRESAIAPPPLVQLGKREIVSCPRCGSADTREETFFGSTACKALYVCESCREPFDYFKPI